MTEQKKKPFDKHFEESIIQAIIIDNDFGQQILEVLDENLFDLLHTRKITEILRDHYYRHQTFPSVNLLETICKREITEEILSKRCLDFIVRMKQNPLNGDIGYVKEKSLEYFRLQTVAKALSDQILPRIENGQNLEDIVAIFQKAVSKGTSRDIGYDYVNDDEKRFIDTTEDKIPTMWPYLNALLNGGVEKKRLLTWIGAAGAGKSALLAGMGVEALLQGKTVVHYTLELSEIDVARKYDAIMTGVEINHVPGNRDKILHELKQKLPSTSRFIIKEYPMKGASVETIKSHLSRLKLTDVTPDLIIIDYGDLLRGVEVKSKEERRHGLEAIWQDMKSLAQTVKVPVITATQTNRSGYNSDIITPDQVSEDFSKIMTSDIVCTVARNMEQKELGIGKMYLAKNRQGRDGIVFGYKMNPATAQVEMFEDVIEVEPEQTQKEDITQKLQKKVASLKK